MNKSGHYQRKLRKQQLLNEIQQQRQLLAAYGRKWLEVTQPYDKGWQALAAFKPYIAIGSGLVLLYGLRHPKRFYRWSRRMISILSVVKIVRNALYKNES
ncbi:YqjK-like family protein [Xenorhabdus sp. DI]|uniref:YqjK-like family protein n=1 Tax=Xenorhabdus doucetiae TaxID=351671 RepID=UPI0019863872|nr:MULTISPECIES: YqjK-like family protein [unclassified Xenorhabdus]MBD2783932.1 YqjK-like family protein [Xenorhabdus sp. 3]MBD2788512.1 YqjK-like family protein [Xenorhabdus sp. DI]MBD2798070.1 YqjK-like family protein [Xenorhabdus sp. 18]